MSTEYERYDVYIADVPYEDEPKSKARPVLILDYETMTVICLKMTTHAPRKGEYTLRQWQYAGLDKPTTVRMSKRLRLSSDNLIKKVGKLHPVDIYAIQKLQSGY